MLPQAEKQRGSRILSQRLRAMFKPSIFPTSLGHYHFRPFNYTLKHLILQT